MPCFLLHMIATPNRQAYRDPDVKDVVGEIPRLFCASSNPPSELLPSQATRCLAVERPCWNPQNLTSGDPAAATG